MKRYLLISIIILLVLFIIVYALIINKDSKKSIASVNSNNESAKHLDFISDIPIPDSITFYYGGLQKTFLKDTYEFNKIIKLNNNRDEKNLNTLELQIGY